MIPAGIFLVGMFLFSLWLCGINPVRVYATLIELAIIVLPVFMVWTIVRLA